MYVPTNRDSTYLKQKPNTIEKKNRKIYNYKLETFNTALSTSNTTSGQKISKVPEDLNNIINKLDPSSIYRILYLTAKYLFFSRAHGAFTKTNHILR